jgi:SRSO17 transposase
MLFDETPMLGCVRDYAQIAITIANKTDSAALWDEMVRKYHYLGFGMMIGQSVKYLAYAGDKPIAALSFNRGSLHVEARDAYIGWTDEGRRQNLKYVISNHRYLILPWIRVKNLASYLLGRCLRRLPNDWSQLYGYEPKLVETFVDSEHYKGTCYLASNWKLIGETKGFSKIGNQFVYHGQKKKVFLYELNKRFIPSLSPDIRRPPQSDPWEKTKMMLSMPDWTPTLFEQLGLTAEEIQNLGADLFGYLDNFRDCFSRDCQQKHFCVYIRGLLSNLERKSIEPIAVKYGGEESKDDHDICYQEKVKSRLNAVQALQFFMKESKWDLGKMLYIYQELARYHFQSSRGMITIDGTDMPKYGKESVGVTRQYCGNTGKIDNCQSLVVVGYTSPKGYCLYDYELYMPEKWCDPDNDEYVKRRIKCGVPEKVKFRTKNEIACDLVNAAVRRGLLAGCIGFDAPFGHDRKFLDSLPAGIPYFGNVHQTDKFYATMPETVSPDQKKRRGRPSTKPVFTVKPQSVKDIIANSATPWCAVEYGIGAKGVLKGEETLTRVFEIRDDKPGECIWLYARKLTNGEIKYAISDAPEDTKPSQFTEWATMRWPIEQSFEESKSELGMQSFEGRSWEGLHRHIQLVFVAHLFIQLMRIKYSVNVEQLSGPGKVIFAATQKEQSTKVSVFTVSQMCKLVICGLLAGFEDVKNELVSVAYTVKSYAKSFVSRCKKYITDLIPVDS